jgi:putative ABC transport system permease protein
MFTHLLKYYLRTISKRKLFSFINISGLAFGIAFILLIGQYIYTESNYNQDINNVSNIYRLIDDNNKNYGIDYRTKDLILENIPEVKNVSVLNRYGIEANVDNKIFHINDMLVVDSNFFSMFNAKFIYGNKYDALSSISNVVLTETTAMNIFGTKDVVGKTILLNHQYDLIVSGVVEDFPENISFKAQLFVSYLNTPEHRLYYKMSCETYDGVDDGQCQYPFNIFVELRDDSDIKSVEEKISGFGEINRFRYSKNVKLTSLKDNYFNLDYNDQDLAHGNVDLIEIMTIIGIIILLLASLNFINLGTAAFRYRMTEIGIKKCFGVDRKKLIQQLLIETLFTCVLAAVLGVIIAEILLPYFNQIINKSLTLQLFSDSNFLTLFVLFVLVLSLTTGLLPALVLSKISPLQIFKADSYLKGTGKNYRGVFTVFQFTITTILIFSLLVISNQIDYVKHKDPGFSIDKLMYLKIDYTLQDKIQIIIDKLREFHTVKSLTATMGIPGDINMSCDGHQSICVDSNSMKTFGFKIVQGRELLPGDFNKACLINMASLKQFEDGDYRNHKVNGSEIVGVISDFNYSSLHNSIGPLVLLYNDWTKNNITIRVSGSVGETMNYIEKIWKEICPEYSLNYGFYDDNYASMYKEEENLATLIKIFSILAIVISCLGIFGLSVFQSELKVKEIGIRKVLGAKISEIIISLSRGFVSWVLIANVIALPIGYYLMDDWLQNFAYKINITWWLVGGSAAIALFIAFFTVSFQAIKAATANPIESLKYE